MKLCLSCFLLIFLGCQPSPSTPTNQPHLKINLSTMGTLRGTVLFQGTPPAPTKIPLASFSQCANPKDRDEDVLIQDGKVQNAFVYIKEGLEGYEFPKAETDVVLDQSGCLYYPRVVGIQTGQTVVIKNSDPFLHNVRGLPKRSHSFNVAMIKGAGEVRRVFDEPEIMVPIRCDVHPWMRAYVGVLNHPYFSVTGPDGSFELKNIPAGNYTLEVWHERLGRKTEKVTVEEKKTSDVNFLLTPSPSPR